MSDVRGRGFRELLRVETALQRFFQALGTFTPPTERVETMDALGRVLAADVRSEMDLPPFDRAAMDGYAVIAENTFGGSPTNPVLLEITGKVGIGEPATIEGVPGTAIAIVTGAPMPTKADAVLMLEYARPGPRSTLEVVRAVSPGENISRRGEDVQRDSVVLRKGTVLRPHDIGVLAGIGRTHVDVIRPPIVSVISTGDELAVHGEHLKPGQIYDMNRPVVIGLIREMGCVPLNLGVAADDERTIALKVEEALERSDVVLISAGTSVGEKDLVPTVVNRAGAPGLVVHGVAIRPGAPTGLAVVKQKPIVLLPGFPVSAIVAFEAFVRPLLTRMLGARPLPPPRMKAKMLRRVPSHGGLRTYVRVKLSRLGDEYVAEPIRASGASMISTIVRADGIVIIPEEKEGIEEGETVEVSLLRPVE